MATYNISVTTAIIQADSQPSNKENTIYSRGNRLFFENTELNSSIYNDIDFSISTFSQRDDDEAKIFSFIFNRSKNDTLGNQTTVSQDDKIGSILFRGSDGNIFRNAAEITSISESDNTGALLFSTTPIGNINNKYNTNCVEAMRITREGLVSIGSKNVNQLRLDSNNTKLLIQNGVMTIRTNAGENFYYNKLLFDKSSNNTDGEHSQVLANNIVGGVEFRGSDGSEYKTIASIRSETVKDTGVNSSTGKIIFSTSNDTTEPIDWITLNQDGDFKVPKLITSNLSVKEVVNSVCIKKDILVKGTSFFSGQVNISNNLCVSKTIFANGIPGLMVNNILLTSRPNEPQKYGYINFGDVAGVYGYGLRAKYNSRNNLKLLDDVKIQFKNEGETNWRDIGNAQGAIANVSNSNKGFIPTFTGTNNDISGNKSLQFLGKHLFINANVNLTNNLNIGGKLSVGKDSFFKNNLNVKNNLTVQNSTNITGNLSVRGITNLSGNLHVGNVLCVRKTLSVSSIGGIYNEGDLSVGGDVVIGGTLKIPRIDEAQFTITGKANFDKGLNVFGRTNINGNLSVQGFTNLKSNLTIDTLSHTNISKFLSIGGTANLNSLKVNNNFFGKGVFQIDSNFVVNSDTNCTTIVVTGTTDIGGNILCNNLSVANNFTVVQDMTIDNDLLINNTLSVSGNTILNGDFNVAKKINIDGSLGVNNNVNLNSNVRIVGMTNIKGVLKVDGSTNIGRNLTLGSNTYDISPSLWYKLNGNVLDSSGNNYHGTLVNAVLTENRFGEPESAYNFNAVDRYIALSGQFSDTGDTNATALLSENVRSSLVAFYKFDLNADDSSGNNYNATNNGATIEDPGVDGLGIETSFGFNGVSNYVNAPNPSQDLSGNLTISLWFYLNNLTGTQTLVSKGFNKEFELQIDGGMLKLLNGSADGHYSYTGPDLSNLSLNVWYNLIVIRSGSGSSWTSSFYINGTLQNTASGVLASGSADNIPQASTNNVFIGARNNSTIAENYFNGRLDNVRYYNRTLSTDEIMEIYLGLIPKLTMSFWVRTSDISPRQYFLSLNNNTQASSRTCELSLYLQEGAIIANYRPLNGSSNLFTLNNAIEKNRWYHIVFETNQLDDIYNLYINGVLRQTATIPKGYTFFNWYLGSATDDRDDNVFDKHLRGELDDFKVIRTSLTQEQINLLYASRDNEPHLFISNNLSVGGTSYLSDVNITNNIKVEGNVNFRNVLQVNGKIHTDNNIKIHPNRYLNFNTEVFGTGTEGVGIRDNLGTMQFRNAGSLWRNIVETNNAVSSLSDAGINRLITFTGLDSIKGESNLLFNGNNLLVNGKVNILNNLCIGRNLSIGTRETEGIGSVISLGFGSKGSESKTFTYSGEGSAKDNITTAIGFNATASGLNATSIGLRTSSRSFSQTTFGMYSKSISSSSSDYLSSDPVFVIGSGISDSSRKNALVMRKSGDTEIFGNVNIIKSLNVSGHVNISGFMHMNKLEFLTINVSNGINIGNSVKKNTPVGIEALKNNNSGDNNNTSYGYRAGYSIQSGGHNIYVGSLAGGDYSQTKTDGSYNIGLGSGSGRYITNGMNNILIGYNSGSEITYCGRNNIIIGSESEASLSSSLNEIVIGDNLRGHGENIATLGNSNLISITPDSKSKVDIGSKNYNLKAVYANRFITTSNNLTNVRIGENSGNLIGTSINAMHNTIIGSNSDISLANGLNQIVIGYNVTGIGNNTMTLGNTYLTDVYLGQCSIATLHCNSIFAKGNVNIAGKLNVAGSVNIAGTFHANDIKLLSGKYINFGPITGSSGYGLRENSGDIQFKNLGGSWAKIQTFPDSLSNNLNVFGPTNLNGTLSLLGNTNLTGELRIGNNLNIGGNLSIGGTSLINASVSFTGLTRISDNFSIQGRTNIGGGLNVSGQTNLNGTLSVSGASYLSSANIKGNLSVLGGVNIKGTLNVRDTLYAQNSVKYFEEAESPYGQGTSLKLRLKLNEDANDSSGNGNSATVTGSTDSNFGPTTIDGRNGWRLGHSGSKYLTLSSINFNSLLGSSSSQPFTITFWVKSLTDTGYTEGDNSATRYAYFFSKAGMDPSGGGGWPIYIYFAKDTSGVAQLWFAALTAGYATAWTASGITTLFSNASNWNHIVWSYNGGLDGDSSAQKLYINGQLVSTKSGPQSFHQSAFTDSGVNQTIGFWYNGGSSATSTFKGYLSDLRIYNEEVNASNILSIYNEPPTISYINFGHKTGTDGYGLRSSYNYMEYKNKNNTSWTQVGYQENFSSGLKVTGSTNIAGKLSVSGHTTISGDLMVGGSLNIANKLSVGGSSYFSNVNIGHNIKIDERPANIGAGILAAGPVAAWNNIKFGNMYKNELFINLKGLNKGSSESRVAGKDSANECHFGKITYEKFGQIKLIRFSKVGYTLINNAAYGGMMNVYWDSSIKNYNDSLDYNNQLFSKYFSSNLDYDQWDSIMPGHPGGGHDKPLPNNIYIYIGTDRNDSRINYDYLFTLRFLGW